MQLDKNTRVRLNRLAREQLKLRLLSDIAMDMQICKLENLDCKEYLLELKNIIEGFLEGKEND